MPYNPSVNDHSGAILAAGINSAAERLMGGYVGRRQEKDEAAMLRELLGGGQPLAGDVSGGEPQGASQGTGEAAGEVTEAQKKAAQSTKALRMFLQADHNLPKEVLETMSLGQLRGAARKVEMDRMRRDEGLKFMEEQRRQETHAQNLQDVGEQMQRMQDLKHNEDLQQPFMDLLMQKQQASPGPFTPEDVAHASAVTGYRLPPEQMMRYFMNEGGSQASQFFTRDQVGNLIPMKGAPNVGVAVLGPNNSQLVYNPGSEIAASPIVGQDGTVVGQGIQNKRGGVQVLKPAANPELDRAHARLEKLRTERLKLTTLVRVDKTADPEAKIKSLNAMNGEIQRTLAEIERLSGRRPAPVASDAEQYTGQLGDTLAPLNSTLNTTTNTVVTPPQTNQVIRYRLVNGQLVR